MGRGPCARMQAGWCPYGGRTCVESRFPCSKWTSGKKRAAALARWARARKAAGVEKLKGSGVGGHGDILAEGPIAR